MSIATQRLATALAAVTSLAATTTTACQTDATLVPPDPGLERMLEQPRVDPYEQPMRAPPAGALAYDWSARDPRVQDGRDERGELVARVPIAVTPALMERGRRAYDVTCGACHGVLGDGRTVVASHMALRKPPSLHEARFREMPDGEIYSGHRRRLRADAGVPRAPRRARPLGRGRVPARAPAQPARTGRVAPAGPAPGARAASPRRGGAAMSATRSLAWLALALVCAVAGGAGLAVAWSIDPTQAAHAYLTVYLFVATTLIGALGVLVIGHAASAGWFVVLRRQAEHVVAALPAVAILAAPILLWPAALYPWAGARSALPADVRQVLVATGGWLTPSAFAARAIAVLALFVVFGEALRAASLRQDRAADPETRKRLARRMRALSAAAIPVLSIALTLAALTG